MDSQDLSLLLDPIIALARQAGQAILQVAASGNLQTTVKTDDSPLTAADLAANRLIMAGLSELTPTVPIISEEALNPTAKRLDERAIWLVDPLDGTVEFVKGGPHYTVNIAYVVNHEPVLGVVYAPALGVTYYAAQGQGAWKQDHEAKPVSLSRTQVHKPPIIAVSGSHLDPQTAQLLEQFGPHHLLALSSSLKLCYVADGTVDLYPRLAASMEWDTAAADAIVRASGGQTVAIDGFQPLPYNKPDLHNLGFVALTDDTLLGHLQTLLP